MQDANSIYKRKYEVPIIWFTFVSTHNPKDATWGI